MKLEEIQFAFTRSVAKLFSFSFDQGYELTLGEAYRTAYQASKYAADGTGIMGSLHCQRLAIDLNLFKGGALLSTVDDFKPLGEYWISLTVPGLPHEWGGSWHSIDADHFSISPDNGKTK